MVILISLEQAGETILTSEELIHILGSTQSLKIGRTWPNLYLKLIGISAANILIANTEAQSTGLTYQE